MLRDMPLFLDTVTSAALVTVSTSVAAAHEQRLCALLHLHQPRKAAALKPTLPCKLANKPSGKSSQKKCKNTEAISQGRSKQLSVWFSAHAFTAQQGAQQMRTYTPSMQCVVPVRANTCVNPLTSFACSACSVLYLFCTRFVTGSVQTMRPGVARTSFSPFNALCSHSFLSTVLHVLLTFAVLRGSQVRALSRQKVQELLNRIRFGPQQAQARAPTSPAAHVVSKLLATFKSASSPAHVSASKNSLPASTVPITTPCSLLGAVRAVAAVEQHQLVLCS